MKKTLIQRIDVTESGGRATLEFTNIPQTYTDLILRISSRSGRANTNEAIRIAFNSSTSDFSAQYLLGAATAKDANSSPRYSGQSTATTATANTFSNVEIYISNYTSSTTKSYLVNSMTENDAIYAVKDLIQGMWNPSSHQAISSIAFTTDFGNNFLQYTSASLYGVGAGNDGTTTTTVS